MRGSWRADSTAARAEWSTATEKYIKAALARDGVQAVAIQHRAGKSINV